MAKRSKIYGVGVNDSNYATRDYDNSEGKRTIVWECPIFVTWKDMMKRCYSENYHKKRPTYKGCKVCDEWLSFMNFHKWAKDKIGEDTDGKKLHLDKDIVLSGNKIYSPIYCNFISQRLNNFLLTGGGLSNGKNLPLGMSRDHKSGNIFVFCKDPFNRFSKFIGSVSSSQEGAALYKKTKLRYLEDLYNAGYVPEHLIANIKHQITKRSEQ